MTENEVANSPYLDRDLNKLMSGEWISRNMLLFILYGHYKLRNVNEHRCYIEEHFCQLAYKTGLVRIVDMEGFLKYIDVLRM